ncbi:MAG: twin-arginine translocation signal domain-containing protein [Spongiibacteraceae bacterium]|nr:twin-arginine translocation signal domain-containing protein [Spongiibacteraceae bacterium]
MSINRRDFIAASAILSGAAAIPASAMSKNTNNTFPDNFLWGASTAGH